MHVQYLIDSWFGIYCWNMLAAPPFHELFKLRVYILNTSYFKRTHEWAMRQISSSYKKHVALSFYSTTYRWVNGLPVTHGRIPYSISQEICTRFCCALLCCGYAIVHNEFTWKYLSIFIRVALLALGQSLDCHSASEVSLMDMGKSVNVLPQQSTAKQKPCAYFLGYTVHYLIVLHK